MKPFRRNRGVASEGTTSSQLAEENATRFDPGFAPLRIARPRKFETRPSAPPSRGEGRPSGHRAEREPRSPERPVDRPARAFQPLGERKPTRSPEPRSDRPQRPFDPSDHRPTRTFEPRAERPAPRAFEPRAERPAPRAFEPRAERPAPRAFEPRREPPAPPVVAPQPTAVRPVTLPEGPVETFEDLQLIEPLLRAIREEGHERPTPIQVQAIPHALMGRDVFGCAQTGTGKTAAFVLPIVQKLVGSPRSGRPVLRTLVLSPTRELAVQIARSFERYARFTGIRHTVVYGGVPMGPQAFALRRGVDVLIATPGRLCDLMNQGLIDLAQVEVLVLDEADRMLDQGFQPVVSDLAKLMPANRQTLFFSATRPSAIEPFARELLRDPVRVQVAPVASTPDRVEQSVYFVDQEEKRKLLQHILQDPTITRAMVFTRTKFAADKVARMLTEAEIRADAIHGDKTQGARQRALSSFKTGRVRVLVATDVAARGIDVDGVSHVINYDLPAEAEGYVHRIGRTARAGMDGAAYSFCAADERSSLFRIERLIRRRVTIVDEHPFKPEGSPTNASVAERESAMSAPRRTFRPGGDRFRNSGPRPS